MKSSVTVIIPNWNGQAIFEKYLKDTVRVLSGIPIIIVDDGSTDGSVTYVRKFFPEITVITRKEHQGFSSTVNAGVKAAETDIVILLNTDVVPEKGFLEPLLAHFENKNVFAVGCMDKSFENGKVVFRGRGVGWWEKGFFVHARGEVDSNDTAWVSGGSGAFRRSFWDLLGGMDERFNPFYWEDIDLSYRAKAKGYAVMFEPKSLVLHFHEEGKILTSYEKKQIEMIAFRNQLYFVWKHASCKQLVLHILFLPVRIMKKVLRGDTIFFAGFLKACGGLFSIFWERVRVCVLPRTTLS